MADRITETRTGEPAELTSDGNKRASEYREWLERTTKLSPTTIRNYYFVVRKLLNNFQTIDIDAINTFLNLHTRDKYNDLTTHSALSKYLRWIGKQEWLDKKLIERSSDKGLKKLRSNIEVDDIKKLLRHFKEGVCKDVFTIQAYSGCRAIEAWTIETDNVEFNEDSARILIRQKGNKSRQLFIQRDKVEPVILKEEYINRRYLFLPDECQDIERYEFLKTHYHRIEVKYNRAWHLACKSAGLNTYASHDARRAIIRAIYDKFGIHAAKEIAGHNHMNTTARYLPDRETYVNALKEVMD